MQLTNEDIIQFQRLHKERYDKDITKEEAEELGHNLLHLVALIFKPIKKTEVIRPKDSS